MTPKLAHLLLAAAATLPASAFAEGGSPWLPIPGSLSLSLNQTEQSGKDAYIGGTKVPLSGITSGAASRYSRSTTTLRVNYGLSDAVSVDATLGYGRVKVGAADRDSGLADSTLGLNWRVLDEFVRPGLPTLTLRAAAILKGGYDGARLAAIGNDQNGFELAAMVGKQLTPAWALWGEVGVQDRSGAVPNAVFVGLGARYSLTPAWSTSLGYSEKKYSGGLDIAGPGFSPARFQEVAAERGIVKLGLGYAFAPNQGLALNLGQVVSGRNTVNDDRIAGISYTLGF
jgi:hypothetical protein